MKPKILSGKSALIRKASSTVFIAVVVASVAVSFTLVFLKFLWGVKAFNDKVIEGKSQARDTLQANANSLEELTRNYKTLEESDQVNSKLVLDALPGKYDFPAIATSIESLALQSGVTLKTFGGEDHSSESQSSAAVPEPAEITFNVVVIGGYNNVQTFLQKLEKTIRPMNVKILKLSGTQTNLEATVDVITHYQPSQSLELETKTVE